MGVVKWCSLIWITSVTLDGVSCISEYNYAHERDELLREEKEFGKNTQSFHRDEIIVDNYMEYLKWVEFERTRDAFPPSRPIEQILDTIKEAEIYRVLKKFPKGGNMHLHQNHILSKKIMLDTIFNSEMLQFLCVDTSYDAAWRLSFYDTPPAGWEKVASNQTKYSKEAIYKHINFIDVLSDNAKAYPTDSGIRWTEMSPLFGSAGNEIVSFVNYTRTHLRLLFEAARAENVQYLEARASPHDIYYVDDSSPDGHVVIDSEDDDLWYTTVKEMIKEFQGSYPDFIGYREIIQGKRYKSVENIKNEIKRAKRIRQKYPDILSGFDLVAEEDKGHSLLFFIDEFDENIQQSNLSLLFHTAETNWPKDILTSLHPEDPVSTMDNIYEAIILGTKRVGHGLGFIKHPYLMQVMKQKGIAVEANLVSNMLLGYVTDQRHHPGITYIRYGIPVVLGADDPGTMGYDEFTIDWYQAYMAWGLNLADLKQLALNSLTYSTMTHDEKKIAMSKWYRSWDTFINVTVSRACSTDFTAPTPEIYRIYPADGPAMISTNVRVFGRQFQSAICQTIKCKFGSDETIGRYVYNHMITCPTPANQDAQTVTFSISLSDSNFIPTNLTFTYG